MHTDGRIHLQGSVYSKNWTRPKSCVTQPFVKSTLLILPLLPLSCQFISYFWKMFGCDFLPLHYISLN